MLNRCIEKIYFKYDTATFLEGVLCDYPEDPQFSANTVYKRLMEIVTF